MSRRVPGSSQDTFRDNPNEPPPPSRRPRVTELPEELHNKIILPPREWEQRPGDPLSSRPSHPSSQNTPTQQQQLPSIFARLPGLRGGSDRDRGPLPSLREATSFVPEIRSLNPPRGARQSGSPSHTSGQVLGRDEPAFRQDLSYTSLPRYSADVSNGADEAPYARELPLPEYEGRYEANPATAASLSQRSFTFPATSEERAYSHHARAPATDTLLVPPLARPHEPISGTPPPFRRHLAATPPVFRGPPQTYGGPPMAYPSSASMAGRGDDIIVSPRPTPVHSSIRERKEPGDFGSLHPEYVPAHEESYFPRHMHQLSHPFPMSSDPPPKAERSRSASVEHVGRTSASALVVMGTDPSGSGVPISASERGGASRGRGRNPDKRKATSPISESSREESQIPPEPPVLLGRQQRTAKTAPMRGQSSSSPTMIAPAPRLTAEIPIHPDLLRMPGDMHAEEPFAGTSSKQSTAARSIARKGKGKAKEVGAGDTQEGLADKEQDELQETSDEDGKPHFNFASSGPSRTGSAGGTRAPRTKIEVACNFCRQRKMKCDGLRPTCKNCQRKGHQCEYIEEVRRRGPGKKKKAIERSSKRELEEGEIDEGGAPGSGGPQR
nr:Zn 2Cys6 transcription factor [Sanghuangporus sanghuang]